MKNIILVLSIVSISFLANAQTATQIKVKAKSAKRNLATPVAVAAQNEVKADVAPKQLNQLVANQSFSTQALQAQPGRQLIEVKPQLVNSQLEGMLSDRTKTKMSTSKSVLALEYARGLENGFGLNIISSVGSENVTRNNEKEVTNSGLSDVKVVGSKLITENNNQKIYSMFVSGGLEPARRGTGFSSVTSGNRYSGGYQLGADFLNQFYTTKMNYGYKLGVAVKLPATVEYKTSTLSSTEDQTGGHELSSEFFAESASSSTFKLGGSFGLAMMAPTDFSSKSGNFTDSSSLGQMTAMRLKTYLAMTSGQIELLPSLSYIKNIGSASGSFSIDSIDQTEIELAARIGL